MVRIFLIGVCAALSLNLHAQHADSTLFIKYLDSAKFFRFKNFDNTLFFAEKAKQIILSADLEKKEERKIQVDQVKISSALLFSRWHQCRLYIKESEQSIEESKYQLGARYNLLRIYNELALAQLFYETDDYTNAFASFTKSIDQLQPDSPLNCFKLFVATQYTAGIHKAKGEFDAAVNQYLASIPYYQCYQEKSGKELPQLYSLTHRNVASVYLEMKNYKMTRKHLEKAGSVILTDKKLINKYPDVAIAIYETFASYYRDVGSYDSSLYIFQKAIDLLPHLETFKGRVYQGLGEAYAGIGNFSQAKNHFKNAESFFLKSGSKNVSLAKTHLSYGKLYEQQGQPKDALRQFQESIASLIVDFESDSTLKDPVLKNILSKKLLFSVLKEKSTVLRNFHKQKKDTSYLHRASRTNQLSLALLDSISNEFSLNADKIILAEQSFDAFEVGISIASTLHHLTNDDRYFEQWFSMVDKSKGFVLLENMRLVNRYAGVDPALIDEEKVIKSEMLQTEQELYRAESKGKETPELFMIRDRYATIKRDYTTWVEKIKTSAPSYYKLRFDHGVITTGQIQQKLLQKDEGLIEYFVGDSSLTIFGFSRSQKFATHLKMPKDFLSRVNQLREILTSGNSQSKAAMNETSSYLYDILLKDCLTKIGTKVKSLIIIPDGVLGYVPFEILQATPSSYLANRFGVRYAYSASYLNEQVQKKSSAAKYFFAGFVSAGDDTSKDETSRSNETSNILPGAQAEISSIVKVIKGRTTVFNPATKKEFIEQAPNFRILHLAMHSLVNDQNPMLSELVFSNDSSDSTHNNHLTAIELYNMQLNADMAVLSACNTGFGKVHRGEGIMSLSRAFAYAGVPSAVISLWKVPDNATSKIMANYYYQLNKGLTKDKALQLAKQDFINENPAMAEPFYWAGFILTGNNDAIKFPGSNVWWWVVTGLFTLMVLIFQVRRRMKR